MSLEKVNILVVEDEAIVALDLATGLEKEGYCVVGTADSSEEAIELFRTNDVDIILMDINIIGGKDGIDTAVELLKIKQAPVIYLTALTDAPTIDRVKQTHPAAFLTKPYSIANVRIAIDLALNNFAVAQSKIGNAKVIPLQKSNEKDIHATPDKELILQWNDFIFVKHNYHFIKLRLGDLLYVEADNNYVNIITLDKKLAVRLSLNQLLEKIQFKQLVRIHRSYAVNMNAIQSFNDQLLVINKIELPIGRNYKDDFLRQFDFS